ncbi:MAG: hypothetical protein ABH848_00230 [Candidatus Omnitrophota bacterium]
MKRLVIVFTALFLLCAFTVYVNAAPVTCPASVKEMKGNDYIDKDSNIAFLVSLESDFITEKDLDESDGQVEGTMHVGKLVVSFDKVDFYALLGGTGNLEYSASISGANVLYELEDKFLWGLGASGLIKKWDKHGIQLFGDLSYRTTGDMEYDIVTLNGTQFSKSQLTPATDAKYEEWQIALSVAKKFQYMTPYAGIKYSNLDASADVTISSTRYALSDAENDNPVGIFLGCALMPLDNMSIDLEGRFIDEEAFSVSLNYEF